MGEHARRGGSGGGGGGGGGSGKEGFRSSGSSSDDCGSGGGGGGGSGYVLSTRSGRAAPPNGFDGLTLSTADGKVLIADGHLTVVPSHRYALVGPNGAGKSTLLTAIADGQLPGWRMRTALVRQEAVAPDSAVLQSLFDARAAAMGARALEAERARLEERIDDGCDAAEVAAAASRLGELYEQIESIDGPEAEREARAILIGLQFEEVSTPASELSGGWQQRLALAQALFVGADVLLLDEPTNHLDLPALAWLSEHLVHTRATALIVSHDAHFLSSVCTDVLSIEGERLVHTPGGYESYRARQEQREHRDQTILAAAVHKQARLAASEQQQQQQQSSTNSTLSKRYSELNDRFQSNTLADRGQQKTRARVAQRRKASAERTLRTDMGEKLSAAEAQERVHARKALERSLGFTFDAGPPLANAAPLVRLDGADVCRDGRGVVLGDVTLAVDARARIAIFGANAVGKSTLVSALVGDGSGVSVTAGNVARQPHLRVAYVHQNHLEQLSAELERRTVEYVASQVPGGCSALEARKLLGRVGLGGDSFAHRCVRQLSGGERVRLIFAAVILPCRPHLILLDEPTNHLDVESLRALGAALDGFDGAVVCVSHNREFVASFARQFWVVRRDGDADGAARVHISFAEDQVDAQARVGELAQELTQATGRQHREHAGPRDRAPLPSAAARDDVATPHQTPQPTVVSVPKPEPEPPASSSSLNARQPHRSILPGDAAGRYVPPWKRKGGRACSVDASGGSMPSSGPAVHW